MYQMNPLLELEVQRLRMQELERKWAKQQLLPRRTRRWRLNLLNRRQSSEEHKSRKLTSEPSAA